VSLDTSSNMKLLLSLFLTALVATQVVVSSDDSLNQLVKKKKPKPQEQTERTQQQSMLHLPAESRIVGGSNAAPNAYPFFVSGNGCGGSLIWEDLVLTAAHCVGAWDGNAVVSPNSGSAQQTRSTNSQLQRAHPSYSSSSEAFDFMVVKLNNPVTNPVLIPLNQEFDNPATNADLTVIGYGLLSEDGGTPNKLQEVTVKKVAFNTCNQQYGGDIIDSIMICAGVSGGGKDSCQGDSGGPIFNEAGEQVGVVSWGAGCARPNSPGVYSRVSGVYGWINDRICELADNKPCTCDNSCGTAPTPGPPAQSPTPPSSGGGSGTDYSQPSTDRPNEVVIRVKHDNYPTETGWTLKDDLGALIVSQGEGTFNNRGGTVLQTVYLSDGPFTFRMTDFYGDGICCSYGSGAYEITVNGIMKATGGQFNRAEKKIFIIESFDEETPPGSGGSATREFFVFMTYDNYPEETRWLITRKSDNAVIIEFGYNSGAADGGAYIEPVDLDPGETYVLRLRDSFGDGFCCAYGEGSITVYEVVNGQEYELTSSDGTFGRRQNLQFSVPTTRGAVKTRTTECSDSIDEDFHVDNKTGSRGCAWLSSNMNRFDYLCEFVDTASICPSTCGTCDLFT